MKNLIGMLWSGFGFTLCILLFFCPMFSWWMWFIYIGVVIAYAVTGERVLLWLIDEGQTQREGEL